MVQLAIFSTIAASIALVSAVPVRELADSTTGSNATSTSSAVLPLKSPEFLPKFDTPRYTTVNPVPTGPLNTTSFDATAYPEPWAAPDVNHEEVKAAINAIDWSKVPDIEPRNQDDAMTMDPNDDTGCWWTSTLCTQPKVDYLPADITYCQNVSDFGLTYDDGPLPPSGNEEDDKWAEPRLYDFLASENQLATLFYVGSNVVAYPQAAVRAVQAGHAICGHTWSHQFMTTLTNEQVVAELYWDLRAIKEATGITPKCWRPPYGDVDDRVRAIAHQMGMLTIIWDSDSFDWGLPSIANDFQGTYDQATVDGFFEKWISDREKGLNEHGHIVLEHETSNMTVLVTEKWLPKLKEAFNVISAHECSSDLQNPYWEA